MIKFLPSIMGNKNIQNFALESHNSRLSHAYLVICEDELSLREVLKAMASIIFCDSHNACGNCLPCRKVANGNHANLHMHAADAQEIPVSVISNMISDMVLTATEDAPSVYIIDGADRINEAAQNKLLKTLEEPKDNCIIILGTTHENALLPTIKSRSKQLYINIWNHSSLKSELSVVARQLSQSSELAQRLDFAVDMCEGSIKRGIDLLTNEDYYARFMALKDMLINLVNSTQVTAYLGILGTNRQDVETALSILETLFNHALHNLLEGVESDISAKFSLPAIVNIQDLIIQQYKKLKSNCAISSIEDSLIMGILEVKYKTK